MGQNPWSHFPARQTASFSPNLVTEQAQTSLSNHQRMGIVFAGYCHRSKRGGAVIDQRQRLIQEKYVGMGVSNEARSVTVLLAHIKTLSGYPPTR